MVQTEKVWAAADELGAAAARRRSTASTASARASSGRSQSLREACSRTVDADSAADRRGKGLHAASSISSRGRRSCSRPTKAARSPRAPVPADMTAAVDAAREALIEMVAEADEKLMEKFFEAGTLTDDELVAGLRSATIAGEAVPARLHVGAAEHRRAAAARRDRRVPAVAGRAAVHGRRQGRRAEVARAADEKAPPSAFVWKTIADPFAGRITMFRVVSGALKADSTVLQQDARTRRSGSAPRCCCRARRRRPCRRSRPATSAPSRS